jgi:hypothetical protein
MTSFIFLITTVAPVLSVADMLLVVQCWKRWMHSLRGKIGAASASLQNIMFCVARRKLREVMTWNWFRLSKRSVNGEEKKGITCWSCIFEESWERCWLGVGSYSVKGLLAGKRKKASLANHVFHNRLRFSELVCVKKLKCWLFSFKFGIE